MKFTWTKKGAEASWTDNELEAMLVAHEKFLVANEIGPLRDKLKETETAAAAPLEEIKKQLLAEQLAKEELAKRAAELEREIQPIRRANRNAALKDLLVEKKQLVKPEKLAHVLKLADVADADDDLAVLKKVDAFFAEGSNDDYKFIVQAQINKEEEARKAALLAAQKAVETNTFAGIQVNKTNPEGQQVQTEIKQNAPLTKLGIVG